MYELVINKKNETNTKTPNHKQSSWAYKSRLKSTRSREACDNHLTKQTNMWLVFKLLCVLLFPKTFQQFISLKKNTLTNTKNNMRYMRYNELFP